MTETVVESNEESVIELWAHPNLPETEELKIKLKENGYKVIYHQSYRSQPAISYNGETTYGWNDIKNKYGIDNEYSIINRN